jgi:hypothetical protein
VAFGIIIADRSDPEPRRAEVLADPGKPLWEFAVGRLRVVAALTPLRP